MEIPRLKHPERYKGLYVIEFTDKGLVHGENTCCVGYTAEEVAMLMESETYRNSMKVYRIYNAYPDGRMELQAVPPEKFQLETGMFFYNRDLESARRDYEEIKDIADEQLPCRARLFLGILPNDSRLRYVVGLTYPAEYDADISQWLLEHNLEPGEYADGGVSKLEAINRDARVIQSDQLRAVPSRRARSFEQIIATIGQAIQRVA